MKFRMVLASLALLCITPLVYANCFHDLAYDQELQLIREKVALGSVTDQTFAMLTNDSYRTPDEAQAIFKWATKRDQCIRRNPPPTDPVSQMYKQGHMAHQSLLPSLYEGKMTYGQFAKQLQEIWNTIDARAQQVMGQYQQQQAQQQYQQQREDYLDQACLNRARNQIERAQCGIEKGGRQIGGALLR